MPNRNLKVALGFMTGLAFVFAALAFITMPKGAIYSVVGSDAQPSLSTCGAGTPTVVGTDHAGVITTGTGLLTACTLNFSTTMSSTPVCIISTGSTTVLVAITSMTSSGFSMGMSLTLPGGKIYYLCSMST